MVHYAIKSHGDARFLCGALTAESWVPCEPPSPSQHRCVTCWVCIVVRAGKTVPTILPLYEAECADEAEGPATYAAGAPPNEAVSSMARDAAMTRTTERDRLKTWALSKAKEEL